MPTPSYKFPPVSEVAVGVQFASLPIQTRHLGQFWTEVSKEYPKTQDFPNIIETSEVPKVELLLLQPIRRVLMLSDDEQFLIQVQDNRFHHNWRKTKPEVQYPRFPTVYKKFAESWDHFLAFLKRVSIQPPSVNMYELSYVNEIEISRENVARDIEKHIRMFSRLDKQAFLPEPISALASWRYTLPNSKGYMQANLNHVNKPDNRDAVVLALTCVGPPSSNKAYSMSDWFDTAHEWIVRGFADLTTNDAQQKWEREV